MIRFRTLGSLDLQRHDGTSITELLTQPKRIALLAYLAIEYHGKTCSREEVMRLLWADKDRENARNSLNQSLHVLRRALGPDVLIANREEIGINSQQLECDAALFRTRLDPDLYRGDLLPGFFVPNAWAFEDWLDRTRMDLRETAARFETSSSPSPLPVPVASLLTRRYSMTAIAAVAITLTSVGLIARRSNDRTTTTAVLPFTVHASQQYQYLGEGIADLISAQLEDAGADRHAVGNLAGKKYLPHDIAQRVGARRYVTGSIVQVDGHLQIDASLYDVDGKLLRHTHTGVADPADIFEMTDALASDLFAASTNAHIIDLARAARITTSSQVALAAFLEGEANFRAGRYDNAVRAFERAVAADSTFALAYYRLAIAHVWAGGDILTPLQNAERYHARLPLHQQQLVAAGLAWRGGENTAAEKLYRAIVDRYPDDVEAWNQLIEIWLHTNAARGRDPAEARYACERVLQLDPQNANALWHLALLSARDDRVALDSITKRALALGPADMQSFELRALRAAVLRDPQELAQVRQDARQISFPIVSAMAERIAVFAESPEAAREVLQFGKADSVAERVEKALRTARFDEALGDFDAARRMLAPLEQWHFGTFAQERVFLDLLPAYRPTNAELQNAIRDLERWDAAHDHGATDEAQYWPALREYWIARAYARLGDAAHAEQFIERLARDSSKAGASLTQSARAFLAAAQGDSARALTLIESAYREWWYPEMGESAPQAQASDRFLRAELLRAAGRDQEAGRWYATSQRNSLDDVGFVAIARERRAQLAIR